MAFGYSCRGNLVAGDRAIARCRLMALVRSGGGDAAAPAGYLGNSEAIPKAQPPCDNGARVPGARETFFTNNAAVSGSMDAPAAPSGYATCRGRPPASRRRGDER